MKRNKGTRLWALGLSLIMIFSLTACQQKGNEENSGNVQNQGQNAENDSKAPEGEENGLEPITLTVGVPYSDYGNGVHTEKNAFLQKLKEETGVELEIVVYDADLFSLMAAGDDMTDILVVSTSITTLPNEMIASGKLIPLDDLLDEYGQHIKANIPEALEAVRKEEYGNHIYGLPTHVAYASDVPNKNGWIGIRARYDIYKKIGSPEIADQDDYLEVLKQMVEYERERTGESDIYAFSSLNDWGTWPFTICYPFSHGLMNLAGGTAYYRETGEWVEGFLDEDSIFWAGIEFYNKAYRMGIYDVDGLTQKHVQYQDKIATGKVIATIYDGSPDPQICGEEAIMTYLPGTAFPVLCGTYEVAYPIGYGMEASRAITSNCQYPERAMQVLDYIDSPEGARALRNGVQGVDWDYVEGIPQMLAPMKEAYANGTQNDYRRDRTGDPICWLNLFSGDYVTEDGYSTSLSATEEFKAETATAAQKAFAQDFDPDFSYPGQVYDKWVKEGKVTDIKTMTGALRMSFIPELSEKTSAVLSEVENYLASNISKPILAETEEDFKKARTEIISKFIELGYEEAVEEIGECIEASYQKYEELYGK